MKKSRKEFLRDSALGAAAMIAGIRGEARRGIEEIAGGGLTGDDFPELRKHYMLSGEVIYLNHASIGTIPRPVHEARNRYLELCESNPWRYMWSGEWDEPREEVRGQAAKLLGASADDIAFTHNTTEVFNLLAHGLELGNGDEVLYSNLNHPGASICFQKFAPEYGYSVKTFDIPLESANALSREALLDHYDRRITSATRLLVIPHLDNTVGVRHPLAEISALARDRGVDYVAVDAAQTVGMIPVNLEETGVDMLATSAHKWLQAPKGISLAFFGEKIRSELKPMWVTWGQNRAAWQGTARLYEDYGTRNLPELLTLGHAIDFQSKIDWGERTDCLKSLRAYAKEQAEAYTGLAWRSPAEWEMGGSLCAIGLRRRSANAFHRELWENSGMVFRPFETESLNAVRISPNIITAREELERFFELAGRA